MRKRTCALVVGAALLLTGCASSGTGSQATSSAAPAAPTSAEQAAPVADATAATTSPMGFLRPTPAQEQEMAAALLVIDARMDNADRYVRRTVDTCKDIQEGEFTGDALVARIQQRFSGGTMPDFTPAQAQQVIDATVTVWCHPSTHGWREGPSR